MITDRVRVLAPVVGAQAQILTDEALDFLDQLEGRFGDRRKELLAARVARQVRLDAGEVPSFDPATRAIRDGDWKVAPPPADILDRRCEITGPTDRKMVINALNSGARCFMADFEDATSPRWANLLEGHVNIIDAIEGTIALDAGGKSYRLGDSPGVLFVRPRGWHLVEKHVAIADAPMSASLFDVGLHLFHCMHLRIDRGSGIYLYLPKLESHLEARLWNDVFTFAEDALGAPRGTIRATVLIENILAAFEMDEILYELRDHSAGLNAGRWDYIFSVIRKFRNDAAFVLPDRAAVTMTVPFMRAYTDRLVATCHRRGAHAMGGMAAFIPSRRDPEVNATALAKVREDKRREAEAGFDGTWVAHPDLVATATAEFDAVLGRAPNQIDRSVPTTPVVDENALAASLLAVKATPGSVTETGIRLNIAVGIEYLATWLDGLGAVAINNLMEDAATAEISRSQLWQWVRHGVVLDDGRVVSAALVRTLADTEVDGLRERRRKAGLSGDGSLNAARTLFETVALSDTYVEFLTVPAYEQLEEVSGHA